MNIILKRRTSPAAVENRVFQKSLGNIGIAAGTTYETITEKCLKHQGEQDIFRMGNDIVAQCFYDVSGTWFTRQIL